MTRLLVTAKDLQNKGALVSAGYIGARTNSLVGTKVIGNFLYNIYDPQVILVDLWQRIEAYQKLPRYSKASVVRMIKIYDSVKKAIELIQKEQLCKSFHPSTYMV